MQKMLEKKWLPHVSWVCRGGQQQPPPPPATPNSQRINEETTRTTATYRNERSSGKGTKLTASKVILVFLINMCDWMSIPWIEQSLLRTQTFFSMSSTISLSCSMSLAFHNTASWHTSITPIFPFPQTDKQYVLPPLRSHSCRTFCIIHSNTFSDP